MQLTYDEIIDVSDLKFIPSKRIGYSPQPGLHKISNLNKTAELILPNNVKVSITIDDIRLKTNLNNNQNLRFTEKSFILTVLCFNQSHSGPLNDPPEAYIQKIAGTYKSNKSIDITEFVKIHLNCDCNNGSIVYGIRETILYSFGLDKPTGHKIHKEPRSKLFKKINISVYPISRFT